MATFLCKIGIVIWIWLCNGVWTETLTNPADGEAHHCGITDDCTITCGEYNCLGSTFYLYNHQIDMHFTGQHAGWLAKIINVNASSINLTMTSQNSLWLGEVYIDYPYTKVYTNCDGYDACRWTAFYYRTQERVTHICAGGSGCTRATIHAITSIDLQCHNQQNACGGLDVIWPTDPVHIRQSRMIHYVNNEHVTRSPRYLHLANTDIAPNITCLQGCTNFELSIFYGSKFDQICSFNDSTCIPTILAYKDPYDVSAFNNDFYPSYRNGDYTFSQNTILSIHRYESGWLEGGKEFYHANLPTNINFISDNDAFVSVLCTDCNELVLNFSTISNSAITVIDTALWLVVDGPQNSITTSILSARMWPARFELQHTPNVWFNGLPEGKAAKAEDCNDPAQLCRSEIFLANQTNVTIKGFLQAENDCCRADEKVDVYSNFGPSVMDRWDVQCGTDINQCVFFKFHPTFAPTSSPTIPTINPTRLPSLSPTLPSIDPTAFPTGNSQSPTVPTTDPSTAPSFSPTLFPSSAPTSPPTLAPSSAPTHPPTKGPWSEAAVEQETTAISEGDGRRTRIVENNPVLFTVIWILVALVAVCLVALVVYVIKKKCVKGEKKYSGGLQMAQPGASETGKATSAAAGAPGLDLIPSLPPEGERQNTNEQAVMLDDDESENDLENGLYGKGTEATAGGTTKGNETAGNDTDLNMPQ
eukprot:946028_1